MLQEHRRVLAAEADRLELENRETLARVALAEEENQRERDKALGSRAVARVEFSLRSHIKGEKDDNGKEVQLTNIKVFYLLKRTPGDQRSMEMQVARENTGALTTDSCNVLEIEKFLETRACVQLWVRPWLDNFIDDQQLATIERDEVFRGIKFSPGLLVEQEKKPKR